MVGKLEALRVEFASVAEVFRTAGYRLYFVGGVVRNGLLASEQATQDLDLTTDAPPHRIRELVSPLAEALWLQGERFGTVGVRIRGRILEITSHRSEAYLDDSRKPIVQFSNQLLDDLGRRDFTVNAMALDVDNGTFHDPFGGKVDLEAKILRTPLTPEESFSDDPLRILRAARFVAEYGFEPVVEVVQAAGRLADRISIVSAERIRDELLRLLAVDDPGSGLNLLVEIGVLPRILPEVAMMREDVLDLTLNRVRLAPKSPIMRLAALYLDLDPIQTEGRVQALRFSRREIQVIVGLVRAVKLVRSGDPDGYWSAEAIRRFSWEVGDLLDKAIALSAAAEIPVKGLVEELEKLRAVGELDDLGSALNGREVMATLNLISGPAVGEALVWLSDLRLREGRLPTEEVKTLLVEWWATRSSDISPGGIST